MEYPAAGHPFHFLLHRKIQGQIRAAEAIDGLLGIADQKQRSWLEVTAFICTERKDQICLDMVCILKFIYIDTFILSLEESSGFRVVDDQVPCFLQPRGISCILPVPAEPPL